MVGDRTYHDCSRCRLVFLDRASLPTPEQELDEYRLHRNDPADPRYRAFLATLTTALVPKLAAGAAGLDFGCGPGPAIRPMLMESGFVVRNYDPLFAPDEDALACCYDFVTCTEVVEHLHRPASTFDRLDALLRPGGWLGVMTLLLQDHIDFSRWFYARDPTHVAFYRAETLGWIADRYAWRLETDGTRIALFQKPA